MTLLLAKLLGQAEGKKYVARKEEKEERNERNGEREAALSPGNGRDLKGFLASI